MSKLLLGESTYVIIEHRQIILPSPSKQNYVANLELPQLTRILETYFFKVTRCCPIPCAWTLESDAIGSPG